MDSYRSLQQLVENNKFRKIVRKEITDGNHLFIQVLDDLRLMRNDNSQLDTIFNLVNFLKKEDEEWVKENIPCTYDPNQFEAKCKELCEKYPLLVNINHEVYSWQEMKENNFGKNMTDYILMCDLV